MLRRLTTGMELSQQATAAPETERRALVVGRRTSRALHVDAGRTTHVGAGGTTSVSAHRTDMPTRHARRTLNARHRTHARRRTPTLSRRAAPGCPVIRRWPAGPRPALLNRLGPATLLNQPGLDTLRNRPAPTASLDLPARPPLDLLAARLSDCRPPSLHH